MIIIYSDSNEEFRREAVKMGKFYNVEPVVVDCGKNEDRHSRRESVISALHATDFVAFICHGWKQGIELGFDTTNTAQLADALRCYGPLRVVLYCCSTAGGGVDGDGGFADHLRDLSGAQVDAHDGAGHCTRRPYVRRFDAGAVAQGGPWIVAPQHDLWPKWYRELHDSDLRFRYPMMTREEIASHLAQ